MHHHDRGPDPVEQRAERLDRVGAGAGQRCFGVRNELRGILVESFDRKLRAREGRRIGRADAEEVPGALARGDLDVGQRARVAFGAGAVEYRGVEARAPAAGVVDHVDRETLAREIGRPALAPVRRGLIGGAGVAGTVHHDDRRSADGLRDAVLHVHLVDGDGAGHGGANRRRAGMARYRGPAVDEEAAFVLQLQRPAEGSCHCGSSCRQQQRQGRGCRAPMSIAVSHGQPP